MRTFIAIAHTAPTDPGFSLDDLPGGAGRLDVLCRYVTAAFLLSHGIREDVTVWVVIRDTITIEFRGDELRHLNPDERSTAALFQRALETAEERAFSHRAVESTPGIYVRRQGIKRTLSVVTDERPLLHLDETGTLLDTDDIPEDPVFLLSDHLDLTKGELDVIGRFEPAPYALGPVEIHGNHAIAVAHNHCDRATHR